MVDFWICLSVPSLADAAAAAALNVNFMPFRTVESGVLSTLQRVSQLLDLAFWKFSHHTMHMRLGCGYSSKRYRLCYL